MDLANQFQEAEQKNDTKKTDDLSQRMDELVAELGPEYTALNEGLEDIDPNSKDSTDISFDPRGARQVVCEIEISFAAMICKAQSIRLCRKDSGAGNSTPGPSRLLRPRSSSGPACRRAAITYPEG
jgi:hypothetical protein